MAERHLRAVGASYTAARRTHDKSDPSPEGVNPPCDIEAENAVISALLIDNDRLCEVRDLLPPVSGNNDESFHGDANRIVYMAILALADEGKPFDVVSVAGWIRARGQIQRIGGAKQLGSLVDATPAVANVRVHAELVRDCAIQRGLIRWHRQQLMAAYGDVGDRQKWREERLREHQLLVERGARIQATSMRDALTASAEREVEAKGVPPVVKTGLWAWDTKMGGMHLGKIHGLIARSGEGKTSCGLQMVCGTCGTFERVEVEPNTWQDDVLVRRELYGRPTRGLVFAVEMSKEEQAERSASREGRVDRSGFHKGLGMGEAGWSAYTRGAAMAAQYPVDFVRDREATTTQIANLIGLHAAQALRNGEVLATVMIDQLQDLCLADEERRNPRGDRRTHLFAAVRTLERAAEKHHVALLLIAQGNASEGIFDSPQCMQAMDYQCFIARPKDSKPGDTLRELRFKKLRNLGDKGEASEVFYHGACWLFSDNRFEPIAEARNNQ